MANDGSFFNNKEDQEDQEDNTPDDESSNDQANEDIVNNIFKRGATGSQDSLKQDANGNISRTSAIPVSEENFDNGAAYNSPDTPPSKPTPINNKSESGVLSSVYQVLTSIDKNIQRLVSNSYDMTKRLNEGLRQEGSAEKIKAVNAAEEEERRKDSMGEKVGGIIDAVFKKAGKMVTSKESGAAFAIGALIAVLPELTSAIKKAKDYINDLIGDKEEKSNVTEVDPGTGVKTMTNVAGIKFYQRPDGAWSITKPEPISPTVQEPETGGRSPHITVSNATDIFSITKKEESNGNLKAMTGDSHNTISYGGLQLNSGGTMQEFLKSPEGKEFQPELSAEPGTLGFGLQWNKFVEKDENAQRFEKAAEKFQLNKLTDEFNGVLPYAESLGFNSNSNDLQSILMSLMNQFNVSKTNDFLREYGAKHRGNMGNAEDQIKGLEEEVYRRYPNTKERRLDELKQLHEQQLKQQNYHMPQAQPPAPVGAVAPQSSSGSIPSQYSTADVPSPANPDDSLRYVLYWNLNHNAQGVG